MFNPKNQFEQDGRVAGAGLQTSNDGRFVRLWFEVPTDRDTWPPIAKGGARSTFYRDLVAVVRWDNDGAELKAYAETTPGTTHWSRNIRNTDHYFQAGMSWPLRGVRFSAQAVPAGSIFSIAGKMAFTPERERLAYLAVLNSSAFDSLMGLFAGKVGGVQYEAGLIRRTPVPQDSERMEPLAVLARRGWSLRRGLDTANEVSHAFELPAALQVDGKTLVDRIECWSRRVADVEAQLATVQADIDDLCFDLYGFSAADRRAISEGFGRNNSVAGESAEDDDEVVVLDPTTLAAQLVGWAVGVAIGRFDVRLATGDRVAPSEPDPFDPLPLVSASMLSGADGAPLAVPPPGYPVDVSPVLVTDPGHPLDIAARVRSVFEAVFGADADVWWSDVARALGGRGGQLESWLGKGLFDFHLKTYSKSRRKAPILWPLGTRSGSYLVWLYGPSVTNDSLFRVLHDVVAPKVALEDMRLTQLRQDGGTSPTAAHRREIDGQAGFVDELRELAETIESVAPLWLPDLNDGTVVVLAPLWRLFAHHRAWSRELGAQWAKLGSGEYDWAQLAMHLWPERVVPKCARDRSLAIAHRLEDVFWVPDDANPEKWHARTAPTTTVDELVAAREDSAVAASLSAET
jgi:hypothetical protein